MKFSNINIDRPALTASEIAKGQSFDSLLKAHAGPSIPWYKANPMLSSFVAVTTLVAIGAAAYLLVDSNSPMEHETSESLVPAVMVEDENKEGTNDSHYKVEEVDLSDLIEWNEVQVDAQNGGEIAFGKSSISIPKNAFTFENGEEVTGTVNLKYREFHDKADFILSGIPMHYDSAGTQYHFVSGGMFELRGVKDGENLAIASGKQLDVKLATNSESGIEEDFNTYKIDEITGQWEYISKQENILKKEATSMIEGIPADQLSDALDVPSNSSQLNLESYSQIPDLEEIEENITSIQNQKPTKPEKADPTAFQIELQYDKEQFPELSAFDNVLFEVLPSNKNFDPKDSQKEWNSVKIQKIEGENNFLVKFKRKGEKLNVKCKAVIPETDWEVANESYNALMNDYENKLEIANAERARVAKEEADRRKEIAEKQLQARKDAIAFREQASQIARTTNDLYRAFSVSGFGIYNCDTPYVLPRGRKHVNPRFFNTENEILVHGNIYLLDKDKNGVFNMYGGNTIQYNPDADNMLLTITKGNKAAICSDEVLDGYIEDLRGAEIPFKVIETEIEGAADLRKILNGEIDAM